MCESENGVEAREHVDPPVRMLPRRSRGTAAHHSSGNGGGAGAVLPSHESVSTPVATPPVSPVSSGAPSSAPAASTCCKARHPARTKLGAPLGTPIDESDVHTTSTKRFLFSQLTRHAAQGWRKVYAAHALLLYASGGSPPVWACAERAPPKVERLQNSRPGMDLSQRC